MKQKSCSNCKILEDKLKTARKSLKHFVRITREFQKRASPSLVCELTHWQRCHECDRLTCCDNTSEAGRWFKGLKSK